MKKIGILIERDPNENPRMAAYASWAEQILIDKFARYHYRHEINAAGYEIVKETEKAYCVNVPAEEIYTASGNEALKDWTVWMPKKAFAEVFEQH